MSMVDAMIAVINDGLLRCSVVRVAGDHPYRVQMAADHGDFLLVASLDAADELIWRIEDGKSLRDAMSDAGWPLAASEVHP